MPSKIRSTALSAATAALALAASVPSRLHAGFIPIPSSGPYWLCDGAKTTWDDLINCRKAECDDYGSDAFQAMRERCEPLLRQYRAKQCVAKADAPDPGSDDARNPPKNEAPPDRQNDGREPEAAPGPGNTPPAPPSLPTPGAPSGGSEAPPENSHRPLPPCVPATS